VGRGRREWGDVPQVEVGTTVIHRRHCEEVEARDGVFIAVIARRWEG